MRVKNGELIEPVRAEEAGLRRLGRLLSRRPTGWALVGPGGERVPLPSSLHVLLRWAARELGRGRSVSVAAYGGALTTQQAADFLGVSRPHLIDEILGKGLLPFHWVGSHRRVLLSDVEAYRRSRGPVRPATPDTELQGQEPQMHYAA